MVAKSQAKGSGNQSENGKVSEEVPEVLPERITNAVTGEVTAARMRPVFEDEQLQNVSNFEDAIALLDGQYSDASELGSGFEILSSKDQLVDKEFVIVQWNFYTGDMGEFCAMHVMTRDGGKYIVNDGSTGIYKQLRGFTNNTGKRSGMVCRHGLTRSDYKFTDENGNERPATTYYIQ